MNLIFTNTIKLLWVVLLIGGFTVVSEAQITSWSSTLVIPENRQYPASAIWNGRIYVTGGDQYADVTGTNTVYRGTLDPNGNISFWAISTMPVYKAAHACVAWNGYLYVMGGYNDWGNDTRTVRYAQINTDGSLGSWSVAPDMPAVRIGLSAAVWNGRIYAVGGASGIVITARNSLYIGTIAGDGSITSWSSTTIPEARAFHATVAANGYLYVIGGGTGDWADTNATNTVYFAIINADGSLGSWSTTTALPSARNRHSAFFDVAFNQLYVMGGKDGDQVTRSEVWYAPVNANGTLGNWVSTTSLPAARKDFATAVNSADNRAYIVGGTNAGDAPVNIVSYTTDPPLPIQLASFTASIKNLTSVLLKWNTISEVNNYGFEIERRLIGDHSSVVNLPWQKVGFVKGSGTNNEPKEYSFTDSKLPAGKYEYRLKQLDNDGTFKYSQSVEIEIALPKEFILHQNYPNPFNSSTVISYQLPVASIVNLRVYDILGKEVATLVNEQQDAGIYEVQFNASQLSSGVYFYKLTARQTNSGQAGNFTSVRRLMLLK